MFINYIRPRLNPVCSYLLICRNGKQISKLINIFGRIVYEAIGKYVNLAHYRHMIEAELIEKLDTSEQADLSQDQKRNSTVGKIHYQKRKSEDIAARAKKAKDKLQD